MTDPEEIGACDFYLFIYLYYFFFIGMGIQPVFIGMGIQPVQAVFEGMTE
jgi:hypothetical protein